MIVSYITPNPWAVPCEDQGDTFHGAHKTGFSGTLFEPRTKIELAIIRILSAILDKRDWRSKYPEYLFVWIEQARAQDPSLQHFHVKDWMKDALDYCTQESRSVGFDRCGIPHVFGKWPAKSTCHQWRILVQRYVESKSDLKQVRIHPGSEELMYDVVHPCWHSNKVFLPATFHLRTKRFSSIIPNLHPSWKALYRLIGDAVQEAIPLWCKCLQTSSSTKTKSIPGVNPFPFGERKWFGSSWLKNLTDDFGNLRMTYLREVGAEEEEFQLDQVQIQQSAVWPEKVVFDLEERKPQKKVENDFHICHEIKMTSTRIRTPHVSEKQFVRLPAPLEKLSEKTELQLYVKIASIRLSPDTQTEYKGTSWHVEGLPEEHIVATAIYYFEEENVTASHLEFRVPVSDPPYEQNDEQAVDYLYDFGWSGNPLQILGKVRTQQDRMICFPNCLHHRVSPFKLVDATKLGSRSFLVLWLVDPKKPITIPKGVRQRSWLNHELKCVMPVQVLRDLIVAYLSRWTESALIRAVQNQGKKRKLVMDKMACNAEHRELNLCEH